MKRRRDEDDQADASEALEGEASITVNRPSVNVESESQSEFNTPTKRKRGRPPGSKNKPKDLDATPEATPTSARKTNILSTTKGKRLFATPTKSRGNDNAEIDATPTAVRNADRSARKKSARRLIERTMAGDVSDGENIEEDDDDLARRIYGEADGGEPWDEEPLGQPVGDVEEVDTATAEPQTPSKRGRGRPKGSKNKPSPPPPPDMPAYEQYFYDNRPAGVKTSNHTLSSLNLLTHEEYFSLIREYVDPHEREEAFLEELHTRSFDQWLFELNEGFNLCLYGWGSKRRLATKFASYIYHSQTEKISSQESPKIIIINGYAPNLSPRDFLSTISNLLFRHSESSTSNLKLGAQPADVVDSILSHLTSKPPSTPLTIIVHSLDAPPLRRSATQTLLARLAAHPKVNLIATADIPNFPLLWDSSQRSQFNFAFHDSTTFTPFGPEISAVDDVHELLGRSGRRIGGREGVTYVLKSLPENARNLYRILVAEQLVVLEEGVGLDMDAGLNGTSADAENAAVEYRVLYQKAAEEFICSSEMAFRTLLKEFHDHQMITSKRDALGTELLSVPFRKDELETILEDII
ncbi:ORC2-domain-containing protein [Xylona heveae TC161]|uniref:Origin recognition complex subunit 2 n=1 Tax=Xylona heveae (strain CBS 132557 / TC161) TaxID=1328760 RepID=A0A164ZJR9_XYLHT|nr:ORC2-domain-containing protein [Xylona heveae TC161]KZF19183.1 ORC2-domain-containing protein [Xylona heveae TC161]